MDRHYLRSVEKHRTGSIRYVLPFFPKNEGKRSTQSDSGIHIWCLQSDSCHHDMEENDYHKINFILERVEWDEAFMLDLYIVKHGLISLFMEAGNHFEILVADVRGGRIVEELHHG